MPAPTITVWARSRICLLPRTTPSWQPRLRNQEMVASTATALPRPPCRTQVTPGTVPGRPRDRPGSTGPRLLDRDLLVDRVQVDPLASAVDLGHQVDHQRQRV